MSKPTYEELEAQVKQLAAENAVILQDRAVILEEFDDTCVGIGMRRGEMAEQYPTPVVANTDAFLASLRAEGRAEGVDMFGQWMKKDGYPWEGDYSAISRMTDIFAAQLRSQSEQVKGV